MARRFDLLVFDWDGTLMDSPGAIVGAVQAACRDLGVPEPSYAHASHAIGLGLVDALRHSVPGLSESERLKMVERYRFHYLSHDHELNLYHGAAELIADLLASGYVLAVATGKSRKGLDRALMHSGLGGYFSATRTADECFSKPHPQMLEELMSEFSIPQERTLMIGDTTHDLQMAINAKVDSLAVSHGAHSAEELLALSPLGCLQGFDEVGAWLRMHA